MVRRTVRSAPTIAGISAHYHDAAACILVGGELVAAAQEERFSRRKHDPSIPRAAFRYCLAEAGLTIADLDCLAYYEDPVKKLNRQLSMAVPHPSSSASDDPFRLDATRAEREIRDLLGWEGEIQWVGHHQAHAASAYYYSGFSNAGVLTVDAVGEWATTSYGRATGHGLELFEEVRFPDSLGLLYSTVTAYLGFEVNDAEYKVMGLAPYGEPRYVDRVRALIEEREAGQFRLDMRYFAFMQGSVMYSPELCRLFGHLPRPLGTEPDQFSADVARSLQVVLEEILLHKVSYLHACVPSENLCLAGGVALNCVAVGRIAREGPYRHVFVQPAAGDAGGALGAAAAAHARLTAECPAPLRHVYLGPGFGREDVARLFGSCTAFVSDYRGRESDLLEETVARLAAGRVIGWFQGRMEFGPRALGNRSILADPRDPPMRERVNRLVKKREAFRPFAPAVLLQKASQHFVLDRAAPFMTETCQVRSALSLPAITHVDGSARVQTVDAQTNPRFHRLLEAFDRRTGCPVLLNTSFNLHGEPIVLSPVDALRCFIRSGLDTLVVEDYLLDREKIPESWLRTAGVSAAQPGMVSESVYTLL